MCGEIDVTGGQKMNAEVDTRSTRPQISGKGPDICLSARSGVLHTLLSWVV